MPCYNAAPYIAAAIRSVQAQNWPNIEIVVVDDGSSDNSAALVRETFPEVRVIQQANQGVAVARNTGIEQARGEWIAFLDADDIWLPGKLEAQVKLLQSTPDARMAYTAWQVWTSTDPAPSTQYLAELGNRSGDTQMRSGPTGWIYPALLLTCVVWTSTVLAHRSVFADVGQFDTALRIGEDYDMWLRASRVTQILRVPLPYALYRLHTSSITRSVPEMNHRNLIVGRALAQWGYSAPDGSVASKEAVSVAMAKSWCDFAWAHFLAGNYARATHASLDAVRSNWKLISGWKMLAKSAARWLINGAVAKPRS